jgi:hypothetical protein
MPPPPPVSPSLISPLYRLDKNTNSLSFVSIMQKNFSGTRYQYVRKALTFIYEGEVKCSSERECDDFEDVAYALQLKISKTKEHHQQKPDPEPIITELPLPIEIQMKIFSYLPTPDLLRNVSLVSKPFRDLAKEPKVHINVSLKLTHFSFELIRFLKRAIFMKELRINASILMGSITAKRTFQKDTRELPSTLDTMASCHYT